MALFSRNKPVIGLDIGSSHVKLLQLEFDQRANKWRLVSFGMTELPPEAIVDGSVMNTNVIVDAITALIAQHRIKTKNVVASVSGNSVIIKRINLPMMTVDELEESIQWEAEQYIPFDINDVNIDVQILEGASEDPGQMEVLLVAARKDLVNEYMALIQQAGLKPVVMDVDSFAVANTFQINYGEVEGSVALINIGASNVNIHVIRDGVSAFTRDIGMGGRRFTEEIQRTLNISYEEAEAMKVGGDESDAAAMVPQEIEQVLASVGESLANEVQRSLDFYLSTSAGEGISQVFLSGGAARTPGLQRAISNQTGLPVEIVDPYRAVEINEREFTPAYLQDIAPQAAVAVGLASRGVRDKAHQIEINLVPQKRNRRQEAVRGELTLVGVGAAVVLALLLAVHVVSLARAGSVQSVNDDLQTEITQKQEIVKEIKAAEEAQSDLEQRLKVIKQLKANKSGPVRMLDELALATPDKLQLTSLVERGGLIELSGISVSNEVISQFLSNLEQSVYFTDVLLIGIDQTEQDGVKLKSFSITSRLVVPGSGDEEQE